MKKIISIVAVTVAFFCVHLSGNHGANLSVYYCFAESTDIAEKYPELIRYLEGEDFTNAEAYIHELRLAKEKNKLGEIDKYLVKVEINNDNFLDYFEPIVVPYKNAFDELVFMTVGVRSKKYDDGMILYNGDGIAFEIAVKGYDNPIVEELTMEGLMVWCSIGKAQNLTGNDCTFIRVTPGTITYVSKDYVDSIETKEIQSQRGWKDDIVCLKNGESLMHRYYMEYSY